MSASESILADLTRIMAGKELEPKYWFSKTSFKESYTKSVWWTAPALSGLNTASSR